MELYIVTIDTTYANKLGKSLQNYGICLAADENAARERFLMPLRQRVQSQILAELFPYIYAYKLSDITSTLNEQNPLWSYVPTSQQKVIGQQIKAPFMSKQFSNPEVVVANNEVAPTPTTPVEQPKVEVKEEFKAPEGVTDPVQIAMLKTMFDMSQEIKRLKNAPSAPAAPAKVSVADLESRFHAPITTNGDRPIDPRSIPVPEIPNVVALPKGKIDTVTLQRLRQNIVKTKLEDIDDVGMDSGSN